MNRIRTQSWVWLLLAGCVSLGFAADSTAPIDHPWPQWRGPGGNGVSPETDLPVQWGPNSENLRWQTPLPGQGVSSPVISRGRVFITTAYESTQAALSSRFMVISSLTLTMLLTIGWALRWRNQRRRFQQGLFSEWPRNQVMWADEILTLLVVLAFVLSALLALLVPARFDLWLDHVGAWVAQKYPDLEAIVTLDPGVRAGVWLTGGALGLFGLAAATTMARGLIWRLLGTVLILMGAYQLIQQTPLDEWLEKIEMTERILFVAPAVAVALLALLASFEMNLLDTREEPALPNGRSRRALEIRVRNRRIWYPGNTGTLLAILCLVLLAGLSFWPLNYWKSKQGLDRAVLCLDSRSGSILWQKVVWTAPAERKHSDNSYATPTPATDGKHVVVCFGGAVACLNYEGKLLWKNLDERYLNNVRYGSSSSPLIVGNQAIVLQGKEFSSNRPAWLASYNLTTGETEWRIEPTDISEGYTTPLAHTVANKTLILVPSKFRINAYDSDNGQHLWTVATPIDQIVASLVKDGNQLCIGGGTWGPKAVITLDLPDDPRRTPRRRWLVKDGAPDCCSPVFYKEWLFTLTERGTLNCFDRKTGKLVTARGLRGRFLASLVVGDDKLYVCNIRGRVTVLDLKDNLNILAENDLPGKASASPALANGCLFLRIGNSLYCIAGPKVERLPQN